MKTTCSFPVCRAALSTLAIALFVPAAFAATDPDAAMLTVEAAHASRGTTRAGPNGNRRCGTSVVRDVENALPQMSEAQRQRLMEICPGLFGPMIKREQARARGEVSANALPSHPNLTKTVENRDVIVHFIDGTTDPDRVADSNYANTVLSTLAAAVKEEGRQFARAFNEGGGKLHAYIYNLSAAGLDGQWHEPTKTPPTPPGTAAGFIDIDSNLDRSTLRTTCYHEYFHGVQDVYNYGLSLWLAEGQAEWAEVHFAGITADLAGYANNNASSAVNRPDLPYWDLTNGRQYSLGLFMLELEKVKGSRVMKKWLEAVASTNDAVTALTDAIGLDDFQMVQRKYLLSLYQQDIPHIKGKQTAKVPEQPAATELGARIMGSRTPTGALFQKVQKDDRIDNKYWIAKIEDGGGHPEMLFVRNPDKSKKIEKVEPDDDYKELEGYNKADESLVILTDTNTTSETPPATSLDGQILSPFIKVKGQPTVDSPINAGSVSNMTVTYDLIGTPQGQPFFPVEVRVVEKGPDVTDNASGDSNYRTGVDQTTLFTFTTTPQTEGLYKFKVTLATPTRGFAMDKLPQSKDSFKTQVQVIGSGRPLPELPLGTPAGTLKSTAPRLQ